MDDAIPIALASPDRTREMQSSRAELIWSGRALICRRSEHGSARGQLGRGARAARASAIRLPTGRRRVSAKHRARTHRRDTQLRERTPVVCAIDCLPGARRLAPKLTQVARVRSSTNRRGGGEAAVRSRAAFGRPGRLIGRLVWPTRSAHRARCRQTSPTRTRARETRQPGLKAIARVNAGCNCRPRSWGRTVRYMQRESRVEISSGAQPTSGTRPRQ
jgi:hypothetical protein